VSPVDKLGGQSCINELLLKEKLDDQPAKVLRHPLKITERDVYEPAVLIEAALQHDAVVMRIPPQKLAAGLIGQNHAGLDARIGCFAVKPFDDSKDQSADFREQTAVVAEVGPQELGERLCEVKIEGLSE